MKLHRIWSIGILLAVFAVSIGLLLARSAPSRAQTTHTQFFNLGLSKDLSGQGASHLVTHYSCTLPDGANVDMSIVAIGLKLEFTSHEHCDEYTTHGTLAFHWQSTLRSHDGFGPFHGTFTYSDSNGNVATGSVIGTIGSGTHRLPNLGDCENCRVPLHFEGTLVGKFTSGPLYNHSNGLAHLQASLAGDLTGTLPDGVTGATGSLDGAYILPCS